MANQKAKQPATLGGMLGFIGFIAGFILGWSNSENFWVALICGAIVAVLGSVVGNIVQRILTIAVSILLIIGMSYCRGK